MSAGIETLLESHVLLEAVVEDRVDKVASVAVGALRDLLESAKVVHPVHFSGLLVEIVPSDEHVDLVGGFTQGFGHLGANELGSRLNIGLVACAILLQLKVAHNVVRELVSVLLLA